MVRPTFDVAEFVAKDGIDQSTGRASVFTGSGKAAWHGLGTTIAGLADKFQALDLAGLNWNVGLYPMYAQVRDLGDPEGGTRLVEVPRNFAVVREDTYGVLGSVGAYYRPLQNADVFNPLANLVGSDAAIWDTAGALDGGRVVWALAKLNMVIRTTATDVSENYILITHAHDGSRAIRIYMTSVRVVCQNTLRQSMAEADLGLKIRHTGDVVGKTVEQGAKYMAKLRTHIAKMEEETKRMAAVKLERAKARIILEDFFPSRVKLERPDLAPSSEALLESMLENASKRSALAREIVPSTVYAKSERQAETNRGILDSIMANYDRHNDEHKETANTGWGLLNSVTEYIDHDKEYATAEKRFTSTVLGDGGDLKEKVYERVLEYASA